MTSLKNSRVLVIGGSSGIGLAIAAQAAAEQASVTIASRSAERLAAARAALRDSVDAVPLDTGDMRAIETFFSAREAWDHVVVSAAQTASGPVRTLPLADARDAMESKFWGVSRVARAAAIAEGGSLTLVTGFLSVRPSASAVLQGAINAALEGLARGLALELSPIRVNTVSPGTIDTPLWSRMDEDKRKDLFERTAARLPSKRIGQPDDVANAALYLMKTPFAAGSTVRVDGGGAIA